MSLVLGKSYFFKCISSLRRYGIAFMEQLRDRNGDVFSWGTFKRWKRLDPRGPVPFWFDLSIRFLGGIVPLSSSSSLVDDHAVSDVHLSHDFGVIRDTLLTVDAAHFSVYTDGSLFGLGTVDVRTGAVVFFEDINLGLGVGVPGLVSSTLTELQAIVLALECIPFSRSIDLFSDSQAALDACRSESSLVKGHLGVSSNERADALAKGAALSAWHLPHLVNKCFICAGGTAVSGNSRHFVRDVFWSVHRARWEIGVGSRVVDDSLCADINWSKSSMVWHPDSHLASGFTSMRMASLWSACFVVTLRSRIMFFHVLRMPLAVLVLLGAHALAWETLSGLSCSSSCVSQALTFCVSKVGVGVALCKGFVFNEWFCESVSVFKDSKEGAKRVVSFVHDFCLAFWDDIWLVRARHRAFMEKHSLILHDGSAPASVSGLPMVFSAGVVRLLGVAEAFGVGFGFFLPGPSGWSRVEGA
ncbi:hypothetical protein G9A89_020833 [Geosiphon pyriformis]|nr:hypothetical protein G9A89_020833 [Geosiphon pyriformis]